MEKQKKTEQNNDSQDGLTLTFGSKKCPNSLKNVKVPLLAHKLILGFLFNGKLLVLGAHFLKMKMTTVQDKNVTPASHVRRSNVENVETRGSHKLLFVSCIPLTKASRFLSKCRYQHASNTSL